MNNPNALAWKGTPGPWIVDRHPSLKHGGINNHRTVIYRASDVDGPYQTVADVYGDGPEQCKANAHMISAAPEAIEFIADLLYSLSCDIPKMDIPEIMHRGEEILKKAYNH